MKTSTVKAYGTESATSPIHPMDIERRELLPNDVEIDILYCGICHSDLHAARDEWGGATYPMVPGHEILGRVSRTGSAQTKFRLGDLAAIGCIVDSCRECPYCEKSEEMFCENGWTVVFDSEDRILGGHTYGGFSQMIVADSDYVLKVPETSEPAAVAPVLCAGITVYSPLKHWKTGPGKKVGIVGLGGLGHMAIKIARAMGANITVFTTSPSKMEDAKRLGADDAVLSTSREDMKKQKNFDLILDTVSGKHNLNMFLRALRTDGSLVIVGLPSQPMEIGAFNIVHGRKSVTGSNIGGISETQEVLDFCAAHGITADIELIKPGEINEAFDRLERGDVKYRFVIDMKG